MAGRAAHKRDLAVEVRRDDLGHVYSRVLDRALDATADLTRIDGRQRFVVVDRVRGRFPDHEAVLNRAQYLAELLGVEYVEDLTWPCSAAKLGDGCQCPACAAKVDARARK